MIAAEALRAVSIDLSRRCQAGDFGHRHSLLRARMDAHAVTLWAAADDFETHTLASRREIEGISPCHRAAVWLRSMLGLRRGVEAMFPAAPAGQPFDKNTDAHAYVTARRAWMKSQRASLANYRTEQPAPPDALATGRALSADEPRGLA